MCVSFFWTYNFLMDLALQDFMEPRLHTCFQSLDIFINEKMWDFLNGPGLTAPVEQDTDFDYLIYVAMLQLDDTSYTACMW